MALDKNINIKLTKLGKKYTEYRDRVKLASECSINPQTITIYLNGKGTKPYIANMIIAAAENKQQTINA